MHCLQALLCIAFISNRMYRNYVCADVLVLGRDEKKIFPLQNLRK